MSNPIRHVGPVRLLRWDFLQLLDGDLPAAIVLAQFEYEMQVALDHAPQARAQNAKLVAEGKLPIIPEDGWVYLSTDTMTGKLWGIVGRNRICEAYKTLKERGWLLVRRNPVHLWDNQLQYSLDLDAIAGALDAIDVPAPNEEVLPETPDPTPPNPGPATPRNQGTATPLNRGIETPRNQGIQMPRPGGIDPYKTHEEDSREDSTHDRSTAAPSALQSGFEEFWSVYPRKVGKAACWRIWQRLRPNSALTQAIIASVQTHRRSEQWRRQHGQFIPHPSTYLNQGRWEDELTDVPTDRSGQSALQRDAEEINDRLRRVFGEEWDRPSAQGVH